MRSPKFFRLHHITCVNSIHNMSLYDKIFLYRDHGAPQRHSRRASAFQPNGHEGAHITERLLKNRVMPSRRRGPAGVGWLP
jgi:hypothetical protein